MNHSLTHVLIAVKLHCLQKMKYNQLFGFCGSRKNAHHIHVSASYVITYLITS